MKDSFTELVDLLKTYELSISTCESITGGMIASMLVEVPGASKVFKGGLITYTNEIKMNIAKVKPSTLEKFGAISRQTVVEMATNTAEKFKTDICIAVSGNAGPLPDENKPIGLVYVGISVIDKIYVYEFNAKSTNRNDIRIETVAFIFEEMIKLIKKMTKN